MRALSFLQPWADLIISGAKPIENRLRPPAKDTVFPIRLAVHASLGYDDAAVLFIARTCKALNRPLPNWTGPRGAILGIVEFLTCFPANEIAGIERAWAFHDDCPLIQPGREYWSYAVRVVQRFERPIPYKGQLGFFTIPDTLLGTIPDIDHSRPSTTTTNIRQNHE